MIRRDGLDAIDISVVIPTFHREKQLLEAIDSVLRQDGVSLELLVVDDSADGSAQAVVAVLADPRVHYLKRAEPSGGRPAKARNDGARVARGRYLQFLDDDDILEEDALATLSCALDEEPGAGMAFGVIVPFGIDAAKLRDHQHYFNEARRIAGRLRNSRELSASLIFRPAVLVNSACMARRSSFMAAGGFDEDIVVCEDADLWARIAQADGHVFVDTPVLRYRTGAPSMMHNLKENDEKLRLSYQRIQHKYRHQHGWLQFLVMKFWARVMLR